MTASRSLAVAAAALSLLLLVSIPAQADDLGETDEALWSLPEEPDLLAKATQLAAPVQIYEFVRNEVEFVAYHGARSSSINSFLGRIGNDVDIASTLIAMLRSQGIRARYAVATVRAPAADVTSWLGVRDVELAASVLDDQGIQNVALTTGNAHLEFQHVWVQAFLPLDRYRAAGPAAQIDCVATPAPCTWVDLAPAFKRKAQKDPADLIDVTGAVSFDYDAYYHALDPSAASPADGIDRADKGPLEIYEEQILAHLRASFPGKTLEDVADDGAILPERRGLLPESLPFEVLSPVATYDSVAEHDAAETPLWSKFLGLEVRFSSSIIFSGPSIKVSELSTKRLTFTYELGDPERMVARLGGEEIWVPLIAGSVIINGEPVGLGFPFTLELTLDGPPATEPGGEDVVIDVSYPNLTVGGYFLVSAGGETSNFSQVHRAARQLLQANEDYPIVLDPGEEPHVDTNGDGAFTPGVDTPLLDSPNALDALTGGLLFTAQELYYTRLREARDRLQALDHVISPISGFLGVVSSVHEVEYLGETAFAVMPGGLLIDMKGIQFNGNWRNDQPAQTAPEHFELFGHVGSSLEHEVWQEITGFDALSTVRGIQFALRDGATLVDAKKNASEDTLPAAYPALGYATQAPVPFQRRESAIFSTQPVTWFLNPDDGQLHEFQTFKSQVELSTPSVQLLRATWSSDNNIDGFVFCYDDLENQLLALPPSTLLTFVSYCDGTQDNYVTVAQALATHQAKYFAVVDSLGDFFDLFDKAQGFAPAEFQYRDAAISLNFHDTPFVQTLRNDLYLRDFTNQWVEYVLPSRRPSGPFFLFSVHLRKQFEAATGALLTQSYIIQNLSNLIAGGGYVNGEAALELTNTAIFNNEVLTDENLIRSTNNDVVKTPSTADPVSTVTGNMYLDETDLTIKGRGLDLVFTRTYNSGSVRNAGTGQPLSPGWTHSYAMRLRSNDYGRFPDADAVQAPENANGTTSSISYTDERGGEVNYLVDDMGGSPSFAVSPPTGVFDTLALDTPAPGEATLTFRNGVEYVFDTQGADLRNPGVSARLETIQDPFGNRIDLAYDASGRLVSVDDNVNVPARTGLAFTYTPDDRIETIRDWTGRSWSYGYDENGDLATYTNPKGETTEYHYLPEPSGALALLAGALALGLLAGRRERRGRARGLVDLPRAGAALLLASAGVAGDAPPAHADATLLADVVRPADRDGDGEGDVRTRFTYYRNAKAFTNRNALGFGETLDYDLYRKRTRVEDPRGFIQRHFYDANGLLVKRTERDGGIMLFENTPDLLRFRRTDALGFTTSYSYLQNDLGDGTIDGGPSDTFGNVVLEQDPLGNTIETTYDFVLFDQPTSIKDKNGAIRTFSYYTADDPALGEKRGKLAELRLAQLGGATDVLLRRFTYNADGTLRERVDYFEAGNPARTRTTTFSYTDDGLNVEEILVTGSDGTSRHRTFTYDDLGRRTSETLWRRASPTDPTEIPLTTELEYDALDRVVLERDTLGNEAITVYDENGQVEEMRRRYKQPDSSFVERVLEQREYDEADRVTLVRDVLGGETRFEYDEAGNTTRITDPTGASARFEVDAVGRRTAVTSENGHRRETIYDPSGRVVAEIDANGNATTFTHDALGRRTSRTDPLGNTTTFGYDPEGNRTELTDPRGQLDPALRNSEGVTEFREVDELGRVTRILDAEDGETLFEYDLLGNRTKVTDAEGQVTELVYDDLGRLVEIIDPVIETPTDQRETFVVDEAGNVIVATDREGNVTQRFHDPLNRLTEERFLTSGEVETTVYDSFGNVESQANSEVTYTSTYDAKNRLLSKTDSRLGLSLSFEYDAADRLIRKTDYQGDVTSFLHDGTGRLVAEQSAEYVQVSYHYDAAGNLLNRILSNGARTDYTYDAANRLRSITNLAADGTVVHSVSYTYDAGGNIIGSEGTGGTTVYEYDALNQLTLADLPGTAEDRSYQYDGVGNREVETIGSQTRHYIVGAGNRLQEIRQGSAVGPLLRSFDYGVNGAVTVKRDGTGTPILTLTRNDRGQVTTITGAGFTDSFGYDPRKLRVRRDDTQGSHLFHLQGDRLEAVYDAAGGLRAKYLRGSVIDEVVNGYVRDGGALVNVTFHHDELNSVVSLTGHTGTVEESRLYAPFGETLTETGTLPNELAFTGRERDPDTGLYYFRARYYDPEIGRFLSEDPLGFEAGINFYAYVGNNPLGFNDPTGKLIPQLVGGVVGGTTAVVSTYLANPDATPSDLLVAGALGFGGGFLLATPFAATGAQVLAAGTVVGGASNFTTQAVFKGVENVDLVETGIFAGLGGFASIPSAAAATAELSTFAASSLTVAQAPKGIALDLIGGSFAESLPDFTVGQAIDSLGFANPAGNLPLGASGGFVLYPSKPNLNSVAAPYQK